MDICQLSPHSVAWLLAFMIGLGIVVRGRVQVPSLNAGINSGGLILVGTSAAIDISLIFLCSDHCMTLCGTRLMELIKNNP